MRLPLAAAVLLLLWPTLAHALALDGPLVQGGLVVGRVAPGASVTVDGRAVRVSADGRFLMGFGRDAAPRSEIRVTGPGGIVETRTVTVAARTYPEQRIDGLPPRQVTPDPETLTRIRAEGALIAAVRRRDTERPWFAGGFAWPLTGRVTGVFGSRRILNGEPRRPHAGIDIAAPEGTTVAAAADGVVALVHEDMFFTGKTVMIDHGHGLTSVYVHMRDILVADGERVTRGTPIGRVGRTGRATGPHLHWGVSLFATHLDPALLVPPMEARQ